MENYSYTSYPDSGDSSPRSREIEFDNPPPWEDQQHPSNNYKVKFMCSYGGKILPRPNGNQLSYVGGETKILAVDRNIKFSTLVTKLSALCDADVSFKYQLPGEDLDALISVTNDDDLEHTMHEYDRLYRASPKPARIRLFLFPVNTPPAAAAPTQSFGSNEGRSEKERFLDALNSGPIQSSPPPTTLPPPSNVDFLFGLDKGMPPPVAAKVRDPITDSANPVSEVPVSAVEDRVIGLDPIQKHIQDLQRLRVGEEQATYRRNSDDNLAGGFTGDFYVQKMAEKVVPTTLPGTVLPGALPGTVPVPTGYWTEKQISGGVFPATTIGLDQQVYMISPPASVYHAPMGRPMMNPTGQGYYAMQRMQPEVYRDQPVYNVAPPPQSVAAPPTLPPRSAAYSDGYGMVRPATTGGVGVADTGYAQVAYDNGLGRQVYYNSPGGVMPPPPLPQQYQVMAAAAFSADMRSAGAFNQEGSNVAAAKVTQTSV